MSRTKKAHRLIDQAAGQATTLVDHAAVQANALVDQVAPLAEAARERVVTEYVPQARKAGRKARKQMMEQYVPQARASLDDAREAVAAAAATAAAKSPVGPKPKKKRGRTVLKIAVLAGVGTALGQWLRNRNVSPVSMYEAPEPTGNRVPPQPGPDLDLDVDPVPPGAVGEHDPEPEDLSRLEGEAPITPATTTEFPDDSLSSFFSDAMDEPAKGSRRR
ncbi:hypothetical protein [Nocardioides marmorisolisilvae]|uniref:Uncharacterized protein n=1 Tax=Nocardioides marmorisolisilvae TaxID=1542737 RepID=A0A3N0DI41_9ACTN|nr:hypothetical protein [Nocardioides marmorisolisilvae]RNL75348.1 hypothetical protein EFL95_18165 [Nocardioides marmorisolisilvae]